MWPVREGDKGGGGCPTHTVVLGLWPLTHLQGGLACGRRRHHTGSTRWAMTNDHRRGIQPLLCIPGSGAQQERVRSSTMGAPD
eukprot:7384732-Prymnesium_polylepis.1